MAHYCTNCGRKLEDEEVCECQKKNEALNQTVATVEMPLTGEVHQEETRKEKTSGFSNAFKEVIHNTGSMLRKPAETMEKAGEKMPLVVALIYAVLFSLSIIMVLDASYFKLNAIVGRALYYLSGEKTGVGIYFLGILYGILMAVCLLALTTVIMFITVKLLKSDFSIKKAFHITLMLSAYPAIGLLVAFILVWFSVSGAMIAIGISVMLWVVNYGVAVRTQCKMNENSMQVMIYAIMLLVLLAAGARIVGRFSGSIIGSGVASSFSFFSEFM